ncbi:MAG TPA: alpha/beta fold hydrolase [Candidatus Paceibacterota bacterium]|nr:alpha/beta fold hydrolase [Candidatus Paceibacterota bacterium]
MKRVFIVHGWGGNPDEAWMPWLDRELTAAGFAVTRLVMPHPDEPTIDDWVGALAAAVGTPDTDTHFVGHSIGCQTVMRYIASLPEGTNVGRSVLVAPWFGLMNLEEDERPVAKPWIETPIDTDQVRRRASAIRAIFSDDDPVVPVDNVGLYRERLGAQTVVLHGKGHFSEDSGVKELPEASDFLVQ